MNNNCNSSNFLQVPKMTMDEELRRTPEFDDIYRKISEINQLDNSVSALIYKSIEVHADILVRQSTIYNNLLSIYSYLLLHQFHSTLDFHTQHLFLHFNFNIGSDLIFVKIKERKQQ